MSEAQKSRDILFLYVAADFEGVVKPLLEVMLSLGVSSFDLEAVEVESVFSLPDRLIALLNDSHYIVVVLTKNFPVLPWSEVDDNTLRRLLDHVVMVCHGVPHETARAMHSGESFESVDAAGGPEIRGAIFGQHLESKLGYRVQHDGSSAASHRSILAGR